MPAYNFKREFIPKILQRTKFTTIRKVRRYATHPGDNLMLYEGMRTKSCYKVVDTLCTDIQPLVLFPFVRSIYFQRRKQGGEFGTLDQSAIDKLVGEDGFEDSETFFQFFHLYKQERLNDFELIRWDPQYIRIVPGTYERYPQVWEKEVRGEFNGT